MLVSSEKHLQGKENISMHGQMMFTSFYKAIHKLDCSFSVLNKQSVYVARICTSCLLSIMYN